jgi:hypothetical protein
MAAARHHRAIAGSGRDAHEHGLQPERADAQPELIILGHAAADKRAAVVHGGEPGEWLAGDRAADPGQRDRRADRLAHHHLLGMGLGELVAIMAANPWARAVDQRHDRDLDDSGALDQPVEQPELERVDDILGVVQHHRLGGASGRSLVEQQRIVEVVEAVGLGRRPVDLDRHHLDALAGDAGDGRRGRRIVAVMADEDAVIGMFDAPQRRAQHRGYHRRFVPGGHQYGQEARPGGALQLAGEGAWVAAVDRHGAPHPPREIDQVDEQIVGGEDQEAIAANKASSAATRVKSSTASMSIARR